MQVLNALSGHFNLNLNFDYINSCTVAKERLPALKNHKLKTLTKHFCLPAFKHHDATEDAIACAKIFLKLSECFLQPKIDPLLQPKIDPPYKNNNAQI